MRKDTLGGLKTPHIGSLTSGKYSYHGEWQAEILKLSHPSKKRSGGAGGEQKAEMF